MLALSASAPAVSVAQEADRQFEGVAAPEEPGGPELDDPSFDPGGDTALSFDTSPAPAAPETGDDSGEGAPLDVEPTVDLDARLAPLADTDVSSDDDQSGVPPADALPLGNAVPPSDPAPDAAIPPGASAQPSPAAPPTGPAEQAAEQRPATAEPEQAHRPMTHLPTRARYSPADPRSDAGAPASSRRVSEGAGAPSGPTDAGQAGLEPVVQIDRTEPAAPAVDQPPRRAGRSLKDGPDSYVVQPGDSLWSIAKRLLGADASAGHIAREVNRLWSLNRSRIATGDPDLLRVGTRLELR